MTTSTTPPTTPTIPVLMSWSGGKDSAVALDRLRTDLRLSARFVSGGPGFGTPVRYETGEHVLRERRFAYRYLVPTLGDAAAA